MTEPFSAAAVVGRPLPLWSLAALSVLIVVHLLALVVQTLDAPSGPWPPAGGGEPELAEPPRFIPEAVGIAARKYLAALRFEENFRFPSNRPARIQVWFEAIQFDKEGNEVGRTTVPDEHANPWRRQREAMLAHALANDVRRLPPAGEIIPAPGAEPKTIPVWKEPKPDAPMAELTWVPEHLLSRDPGSPDEGPSDWELALSRSYAQYLCRATGAAQVELRRHWFYDRSPFMLLENVEPLTEQQFAERVTSYGKVSDAPGYP